MSRVSTTQQRKRVLDEAEAEQRRLKAKRHSQADAREVQRRERVRLRSIRVRIPRIAEVNLYTARSTEIIPLPVLEKTVILGALTICDGDRIKAAQQLGVDKATMYRKLREYEMGAKEIRRNLSAHCIFELTTKK